MDLRGEEFVQTRNQIRLLMEEGPEFYVDKCFILSYKHQHLRVSFENVEQYVFNRVKNAYEVMMKGEYFKALVELRELEMIVDVFLQNSEADLNQEIVIFLLINLGICFFRYAFYDDAFSCFESCEKRLESGLVILSKYADKSGEMIEPNLFAQQIRLVKNKLIYAKTKLVNGVIFEAVNRKHEALKYYKQSVCSSFDILLDLVMFVTAEKGLHHQKAKVGKKKARCMFTEKQGGRSLSFHRFPQQKADSDSASLEKNSNREKSTEKTRSQRLAQTLESPAEKLLFIFFKNVEEIFPFFRRVYQKNQFLNKFRKFSTVEGIQLPISRIKQAFVRGHSIYSQSLQRMLELNPVSYQQIHQSFFKQSLTLEFVLEMVIEVTLALYQFACLRVQTDAKSKLRDNSAHSEILMNKCLQIAYSFLPISALFVKQIVKKHGDLFGIYRQTIPEYGKMSQQLKFLRSSLNQSQANKLFVPCIRSLKFNKKTHKMDSDEDEVQQNPKPKEREASKPKQRKEEPQKTKRKKNVIIQSLGTKKTPTLFTKILKLMELDEAARSCKNINSKIPTSPSSKMGSKCPTGILSSIKTIDQTPKPGSSVTLKKAPRSVNTGSRKNLQKN